MRLLTRISPLRARPLPPGSIATNRRSHSIPMTLSAAPPFLLGRAQTPPKRQEGCVGEQRAALAHLPHI